MKKILSIILLLGIFQTVFSQIQFEKGFFIDNNNKKTDCLIKNKDWDYNPSEISYKLNENEEAQSIDISLIKEFSIYNFSKYIKANVKIDRSSINLDEIDYDKNPKWSEETLFLKVLIEGKASLYSYREASMIRFFYKTDSSINQLVYKDYFVDLSKLPKDSYSSTSMSNNRRIATSNFFRQQLWLYVRFKNMPMSFIEKIGYTKGELVKYFKNYNEIEEAEYINYIEKGSKGSVNLKINPGISYIQLSLDIDPSIDGSFNNKVIFRVGIETEFILPFNKNKWAIIIAPEYQKFNLENRLINFRYEKINFPIGVRHNFFLNNNSKIFINGFYVSNFCINIKSSFQLGNYIATNIKDTYSYAYGFGFENKKYSIELRNYTKRDLLENFILRVAPFKSTQVILGYKLFSNK